ncbi:MAG: WYL domain-containing protein [Planctomycetota bacterium]|nr:WYL domain-containing protein [Planctomycetota bacterium]
MRTWRTASTRFARSRTCFGCPPPVTPDDSRTFVIDLPDGFGDLAVAMSEQRTVVIAYDGATLGAADRRITPRAMLQSNGRQYVIAYCHAAEMEKMYRLDHSRGPCREDPIGRDVPGSRCTAVVLPLLGG